MNGWGGQILRTSAAALVAKGLPLVESPGVALEQMLDGMQRQGTLAELAARQGTRLQEPEIEALLGQSSKVAALVTRARLRVACEAAERGLHLGSGFTIGDWLARFWPDLHKQTLIDMGRLAVASREGVHRALVDAVLAGSMSVARGARLHRALARIRKAIGQEEYSAAVELLTTAGCEPMFEDSDIDWIIAELLARCLPEDDHEKRKKSIWSLRNVYESNLADGSVKRLIMTFGDDADYEAVRAILQSPLAAPASKEEVEATGEPDLRSAGNRRYDALMTVVRRGVAGTKGEPTTPKAQLIVNIDFETLARDVAGTGMGQPGCGTTLDGHLIPASTVRKLACEAGIIPMVMGGPSEVLDQGRSKRTVTPGQRIRLAARDRCCTFPGCSIPATWCDAHHVVHWVRGSRSDIDNYALLCRRHHTYVHEHGLTATVTALGVVWHLKRRPTSERSTGFGVRSNERMAAAGSPGVDPWMATPPDRP